MTKFLGMFILVFASPPIFDVYYFRMYMSLLLWATLHGLVLLPVLLSYIGEGGVVITLQFPTAYDTVLLYRCVPIWWLNAVSIVM